MESINGSLRRLQTDYVDLYQAHRYDYATPLEETMEAFADVVHSGKAHYIGVSEWTAPSRSGPAHELARELKIQLVSNQPQYSMLWRVIEAEVVPDLRGAGHRPDRLVADRAGRADRQVPAGPAAAGRLPGHRRQVRRRTSSRRWLTDEVLEPGAEAQAARRAGRADAWRSSRSPGCCRTRTSPSAIVGATRPEQVHDNVKASGVKLDADLLKAIDEVARPDRRARPGQDRQPRARP